MSATRRAVLVALLALGLPLAFMGPALLLGRPLIRDDAAQYVYPQFRAYAEALRSGHLYLWDAQQYCGLPALATGQSMGLYPPHLLLFRLLPWQLATHLGYWLHLALAALAFVLVARRLGLSATAAVPGALLYTYSGYQAAHLVHYNFVAGVAHLPLLVWLLDRALEHRRWRDWGLLGLEAALAFVVAHPQVFAIGIFTCLLWLLLAPRRPGAQPSRCPAVAVGLVAAAAVFLLLIMPQLLPTMELARLSREATPPGAAPVAAAGGYGYGRLDLIRLILPNLFGTVQTSVVASGPQFHETCAYVGIAGLLAALAGLVVGFRRREWWFCVAAIALGALLMWSENPLYLLVGKLPYLSSFRAMGRWALTPIFALGLLVARAAQSLSDVTPERRLSALRLVGLAAAVLALALLALWVTFGAEGGSLTLPGRPDRALPVANMAAAIYNWLTGWEPVAVLVGLVLACVGLGLRTGPRWRAAVLVLAIGLPLWHFWALTNRPGPRDYYTRPPETARAVAGARITVLAPELVRPDGWPERSVLDPVYGWRELLAPAVGTVFGVSYAEGYKQGLVTPATFRMWSEYIRYGTQAFTGVTDTTAETVARVGTSADRMKRFHRLCGAQFLVTPGRTDDSDLSVVRDGPVRVYRYRRGVPRAWLVGRAAVVADPEEQLRAIKLRTFDPDAEAVVDRDVPGLTGPVTGTVQADAALQRFTTNCPQPALVVISQAWYPGWRARVDGQPTLLVRTDYAFQGVPVPAGQHEVTLTFAPRPFRLGLGLAAVGLVLLLALLVGCRSPHTEEGEAA